MTLPAGARLGPYEVIEAVGAGGMGEVYRGRDTRLDRVVAIKVLPDPVAGDPERLARFDREAKTLATLNHTNIAQIYGLESGALAMEFVEGEDLSARIADGPLSVEEALSIAHQIADALEAAHEFGIIHRDLKPSNIRLRDDGIVKVLDFGLAKALAPPAAKLSATSAATITSPAMTQRGVILGTASYMAPEQARGRAVDRRADIWAFGVVLYEMTTGRRAFDGETVAETLANVMKSDPDWAPVPVALQRLIRSCLEKDPKRRLRDIGDWWRQIDDPATSGTPSPAWRSWLPWGFTAAAVIVASLLAVLHFRETPPAAPPVRFQIAAPGGTTFEPFMAVSPDEQRVAFTARSADGVVRIWVRDLDSLDARPLGGTEGAHTLFFSPDSRWVGFAAGAAIKKVAIQGGSVVTLCEMPSAAAAGTGSWSRDGAILIGGITTGTIRQVSDAGGSPSPVTELDGSRQEVVHGLPAFLPDGRHFLYVRVSSTAENSGLFIGAVDQRPAEQDLRRLLPNAYALYSATSTGTGRLVYLNQGTLVAQPFDLDRLATAGEPRPLAEGVGNYGALGFFSVVSGVLAYRTGATAGPGRNVQLTWVDRQGKPTGIVGDPNTYVSVALSPSGAQALVDVGTVGAGLGSLDLWVIEFARGISHRITSNPAADRYPIWSPQGDRVAFSASRGGKALDLYARSFDSAGDDELLVKSDIDKAPTSWSRDGRYLLYNESGNVWLLRLEGDRKPVAMLQTEFTEFAARFSPDMRWISYTSDISGQPQVYVRAFDQSKGAWAGGAAIRMSKDGGTQTRWRHDGKELFFQAPPGGTIMAVDVQAGVEFRPGVPRPLFKLQDPFPWDVTADGKRFLVGMTPTAAGLSPISVVLNWQAALAK
jgi:eukaryotic-like serine/threonine-protein kinase